jgi:hypothetical protein
MIIDLSHFKNHYILTYTGEVVSDNVFYEARHWTVRNGYKNKYKKIYLIMLLEAKVKRMSEIALVVRYNTGHDVDNTSILGKMLVDTMKGSIIENDNKKFYKTRVTQYDSSLPKGTVEFNILGND